MCFIPSELWLAQELRLLIDLYRGVFLSPRMFPQVEIIFHT